MTMNEARKEDSKYNEDLKYAVVDDIILYLSSVYGVTEGYIEVGYNAGNDTYVSISVSMEGFEWNTEEVRNMTSSTLDLVDVQGRTLHVSPKGMRDQDED